jgi:hypothetical protein
MAAGYQRIYSEEASGKSTNGRPEFAQLMKALNHGYVVTVVKLDRLVRFEPRPYKISALAEARSPCRGAIAKLSMLSASFSLPPGVQAQSSRGSGVCRRHGMRKRCGYANSKPLQKIIVSFSPEHCSP